MNTSRNSFCHEIIKDDSEVIRQLERKVNEFPREGFKKAFRRLGLEGLEYNHKRVHRIYKKMGLNIRRKVKRRPPARTKESIVIPSRSDHNWSIDFITDVLENGRRFRTFNINDDYNREVLHIEIDYSLKSSPVIWVLKHLIDRRIKPTKIRMDYGPKFIAD